MSTEDSLSRVLQCVRPLLELRSAGRADKPRAVTVIELALEHADAWVDNEAPREGERGGSTDPVSDEERQERRRVAMFAMFAGSEIPRLAERLEKDARLLHTYVQRLTAIVDASKLPEHKEGCASCARMEQLGRSRIGGHYAEVYEKSVKRGLCRWCADYQDANGTWPPVMACELYHSQSPRAAGLWLAKQMVA